jgi:hypothetical protein
MPILSQDSEPGDCIDFAGLSGKQIVNIRKFQRPASWRVFVVMVLPG